MKRFKEKDIDKLIAEEAKRFKEINEYSFYTGKDADDERDLLLGEDDEENPEGNPDEAPEGGASDVGNEKLDAEVDNIENELGIDDVEGGAEGDGGDMPPVDGDTAAAPAPAPVELPAEPAEDEVELDVTELVQKSEEAKGSADEANAKMEELLGRFNQLQSKLSAMDKIAVKIDNLEHEIERRNPTQEERIEMRSLDSYPYNIKLSDFWREHEDKVAKPDEHINGAKKEFILTKDDVNNFNSTEVKRSFSDYEEEDI